MSFLIDPYRYASSLPDFSGYDLTRIYSLFKTSEATIDYCLQIQNADLSATRYVFFDDDNEVSLTSKISTTTTPHATQDLQYWIDNLMVGTVAYVNKIYCQITAHVLSKQTNSSAKLYDTTNGLSTKNSKVSIRFLGVNGYNGSSVTELDTGSSFHISSVTSNETSAAIQYMFCNNTSAATSNDSRIVMSNDRRTSSMFMGFLKNTAATVYINSLDSSDNTANQKRLGLDMNSGTMTSYVSASAQTDTESVTGTWVNDNFILGSQRAAAGPLDGHFQWLGVHDASQSSGELSNLDTSLDNYFSF